MKTARIAGLLAAVTLLGCKLDVLEIETKVRAELTSRGWEFQDVTCATPLKKRIGEKTSCTVKDRDGDSYAVPVEVTASSGELRVAPDMRVLDQKTLGGLSKEIGEGGSVVCPRPVTPVPTGKTVHCELSRDDDFETEVEVSAAANGTLHWQVTDVSVKRKGFSMRVPPDWRRPSKPVDVPKGGVSITQLKRVKAGYSLASLVVVPVVGETAPWNASDLASCQSVARTVATQAGAKYRDAKIVDGPAGPTCKMMVLGTDSSTPLESEMTYVKGTTGTWMITCNHDPRDEVAPKSCDQALLGFKLE